MMIRNNSRIVTKSKDGIVNGFLIPIYNIHDRFHRIVPEQVYLTVCSAGGRKGPHLHRKRTGYFTCIKGNVTITIREDNGQYITFYSGDKWDNATIEVPPNTPTLIENVGSEDAYILNVTAPAWTPEDQDDYPVDDWEEEK